VYLLGPCRSSKITGCHCRRSMPVRIGTRDRPAHSQRS
jgi:hypothetical protein